MARLLILKPGPQSTLQDLGRAQGRRFGIPFGGAADTKAHRLALALVGAPTDAASIEFRLLGPSVEAADGPVAVAVGGTATATVADALGAVRPLEPWRSTTLEPGERLTVGVLSAGAVGYLAMNPMPDIPFVQAARGTMLRASFGGFGGRALASGDALPLVEGAPLTGDRALTPPSGDAGTLRVMLGPQVDHFTTHAIETLSSAAYTVTDNADRMGVRLSGPKLEHSALGPDLMSEGLAPGAIQVPGDGQPIVLGVDAQTIGGYPKIATVITADLPLLGQLKPGDTVRFAAVTLDQAREAREAAEHAIAQAIASIRPAKPLGGLDLDVLYRANLLSGKVDAHAPHHFPHALEE